MRRDRDKYIAFGVNLLVFSVLFIGHYCFGDLFAIGASKPIAFLAMFTAFSMFHDELPCALTGLAVGICMDGVTGETVCFNSIILILIGVTTSLISKHLFNRNIRSAFVLSLLGNLVYFGTRWLIFYAFDSTVISAFTYLLDYAIPSAVYTAVFIIPFFYLERTFYKKIVS